MTNDDPWSRIDRPPAGSSRINARRVAPETPWNLYWAVDSDRNVLLILQHGGGIARPQRLPRFRGLRVETQPADAGTGERIVIRLTDREQRDIFLRFCRDIVEATALAKTEEQAVARFLARTWRWHRLLQGSRDSRLGDEEQKGLIGELLVLERHLLPVLGAVDAVRCWTGPLGTHQDFEISRVRVEAKARSSTPRVIISSEHQLESASADTLFLHVTEMAISTEDAAGAVTVTEVASRIRALMAGQDMAAVELFEDRLEAAGFDWTDDYSDKRWLVGGESIYEVREGFPRITPATVPRGAGEVRYTISLPDCEAFRVVAATLVTAVSGADDDD